MKYHDFGKTGYKVSAIGYGGIVSSQHFDEAAIPGDGQKMSDHHVAWAIDHGINYFDVAPTYGDAQLLMGNSIQSYRKDVYLACKTNRRNRAEAEDEMKESLSLLHTDYFDVYQLHGLVTEEELDECFAPGGTMELLIEMKKQGIARNIGFTAHSEPTALLALERYDFDTVMFPLNWHMHMQHGMGERLRQEVKRRGIGFLGIKSMIEKAWTPEERYASKYPKSWCKPFEMGKDDEVLLAALKYAVSLGEDILVPPGNFEHFSFALEHQDEIFEEPLTEQEKELLKKRLTGVSDAPFYGPECYGG